jgi:hypothetical protein
MSFVFVNSVNYLTSLLETNVIDFLTAASLRERTWIQQFAKPRNPIRLMNREIYDYQKVSPEEHLKHLDSYLQIAPHIISPEDHASIKPTLRHPDLQPNNIFVSEDLRIQHIIDWQHASIQPLTLVANIPKSFQNYGDDISERSIKPELPNDLDSLDEIEQENARELYRRRQIHYFYLHTTRLRNLPHFEALTTKNVVLRQRLYTCAIAPWEGENAALRAALADAYKDWDSLAATPAAEDERTPTISPPPCPLHFTKEELEHATKQFELEMENEEQMEMLSTLYGINSEGHVCHENYDNAKIIMESLKEETVKQASKGDIAKELLEPWAFDDHDEDV